MPWLRLAVGMTQFLTFTRLELVLALNLVAKNMHKPTLKVKEAVLQILAYVANRPSGGHTYARVGAIGPFVW